MKDHNFINLDSRMAFEAMLCELLTHPESMVAFRFSLRHLFYNAYHPPSDGQNATSQQFQRFLLHSLKLTKKYLLSNIMEPAIFTHL